MRKPLGSLTLLALAIGATAIVTSTLRSMSLVRNFDFDGLDVLNIVGSLFREYSFALAMVCAVLIAATMVNDRISPRRQAEFVAGPIDAVDSTDSVDRSALFEAYPELRPEPGRETGPA